MQQMCKWECLDHLCPPSTTCDYSVQRQSKYTFNHSNMKFVVQTSAIGGRYPTNGLMGWSVVRTSNMAGAYHLPVHPVLLMSHDEVVAVIRRQRALVSETVQQRRPTAQREVALVRILAPIFVFELRGSSQCILERRAFHTLTAAAPSQHPRRTAVTRPPQHWTKRVTRVEPGFVARARPPIHSRR